MRGLSVRPVFASWLVLCPCSLLIFYLLPSLTQSSGATSEYCGSGCQATFRTCPAFTPNVPAPAAPKPVSNDGRCGMRYSSSTCKGNGDSQYCSIFGYVLTERLNPASWLMEVYRYCGSGDDFCAANRCQKEFSLCNDSVSSVSGLDAPTSHSTSTFVPSDAASCLASTRIITSVGTETSTLTVQADQITITARSILTLPGADRPTTITKPTTITLNPDPVTVTSTLAPVVITQTFSVTVTSTLVQSLTGMHAISYCWHPVRLTAGTGVILSRIAGGAFLSGFSHRFTIDATNANLPQHIVQPIVLCPNSTYTLSFNMRRTTSVGTISVFGSVQAGSGSLVQMAGGTVGSTLFAGAPNFATFSVPVGGDAVSGVIIIKAGFSGVTGAKEVYVDEVSLTKTS
jgi:hypothetical protein